MTNQRYAGPISRYGTNLTPAESAEIESHILAAEKHLETAEQLMQRRRVAVLEEIDAEGEGRIANRCALLASFCMVCFLALFVGIAHAQTSPPVVRSAVLSWQAPTACAGGTALSNCPVLGYSVQKLDGSTWVEVGTTAANVTTFTDANLPLGAYRYRVLATSAAGPSEPSNEASKVIDVPGAPGSIVITVTVTVTQ